MTNWHGAKEEETGNANKGRDLLGDLGTNGRITLRWILGNWLSGCEWKSSGSL
jgi:hypothetical protein